jgi:hypothetical protein
MSRELNPNGHAPRAQDVEGVLEDILRHPDGSPDIAAYAKLAHRERAAAVAASAREGIRRVREMLSGLRARLAPVARSEPASGKHHATARR